MVVEWIADAGRITSDPTWLALHLQPHDLNRFMSSSDRRVVITGMGLISPLGDTYSDLWDSISNRRSGVELLESVPTDHFVSDFGGECKHFTSEISNFGTLEKKLQRSIKKGLKLMCREIQLGVAAAQLALSDAGLEPGSYDPARMGTLFGSDYIITGPEEFSKAMGECLTENHKFDFSKWAEHGLPKVEPLWLLKYLPNMPASHVAIYNDLRGPSNSLTMREAGANLSVAEAATIIKRGSADKMLAGSTGSRIHLLRTIHIVLQEQLADRHTAAADGDPKKACRPFDADRSGMVLGEGAGVLILETLEDAEQRNAKIFGEVVGYGSSSVVTAAGTPDQKTAFANVLKAALETSGMSPSEVGHIHAHGLSSSNTDREEAAAIKEVLPDVSVTAAKSYMGNLGGGSGVVEMIASIMALQKQQHIPVLNYETPDPDCPIRVVQNESESPGDSFINLNITPQAQASSVLIRRFK
jgi:3-oxoacyl-[acyl-carrier-protein] synthase II